MERFAKIVNGFSLLTIFAKRFIQFVLQGSEYPSEILTSEFCYINSSIKRPHQAGLSLIKLENKTDFCKTVSRKSFYFFIIF